MKLDHLCAEGRNGAGVDVVVHVRFQNADGKETGQCVQDPADQTGLAGAGGRHQVDQETVPVFQERAYLLRVPFVVGLDPSADVEDSKIQFGIAHLSSVFLNTILTARFAIYGSSAFTLSSDRYIVLAFGQSRVS